MSYLVGIDVGGTFTDVLAFDTRTGALSSAKVPSIPDRQWEGLLDALAEIDVAGEAIVGFVHGTTIATNALLEGRVGRVALLTTRGFRDVVEVGRTRRLVGGLFDIGFRRPAPLVPRALRREVDERVAADGSVLVDLDRAGVRSFAELCRAEGVEAVAVCFLNAPVEDRHEVEAAALVGQVLGEGVPVSRSSDVVRELGEFERFTTTVANAALQPVFGRYAEALRRALGARGLTRPVGIMGSNGGTLGLAVAQRFPVRTFLSGPVGGVTGALEIARGAGVRDFITFDMGGTSTDVAVVADELPKITVANRLGAVPLKVPQLDINTIGAGGGSVAWRDVDGSLDVGPESAGAVPGPACYGRGGGRPTVSDANVLLGRLGDRRPLAGGLRLDRGAALAAFRSLAPGAGEAELVELAGGILRLVVLKMAGAVRTVTVHRGLDPKAFSLFGFGGAGPMHVMAVADELGIERAVIPRYPGHLSALGQLMADARHDAVLPWNRRLSDLSPADVRAGAQTLRRAVGALFEAEGRDGEGAALSLTADVRYVGQSFTLPVPIDLDGGDLEGARRAFDAAHRETFGYADPARAAEATALRLVARLRAVKPAVRFEPEPGQPLLERADVVWDEGPIATPFLLRARLPVGAMVEGPAILEEAGGTTVLPPGWRAEVDPQGNLVCRRATLGSP